jgi:hypothetical protein
MNETSTPSERKSMSETPTPRTDAEEKLFFSSISGLPDPSRNYVSINFARQLERELAEAKQHEEDWRGVGVLITERDSLREELRLLKINTMTMIEDTDETKEENKKWRSVAEQLATSERCPNCSDVGYYERWDGKENHDPVQEQCEFCESNPKSRYKANAAFERMKDQTQ